MSEEINITFETLYDMLMQEKQREELLQLDENFFKDVIVYLKQKLGLLEKVSKDNDLFAIGEKDKIEAELKNIYRVLRDLYERREKKIIAIALNKSRTGTMLADMKVMLPEEVDFVDSVIGVLDKYRNGVLGNLIKVEMPSVSKGVIVEQNGEEKEVKEGETMAVRFVHAVPKFVGSDMYVYGPFDKEDLANLPKDVGALLVDKGRAQEVQ